MCLHRFFLGNWNQAGFLAEGRPKRTLREMLTRLRETYCTTTGYEVRLSSFHELTVCSTALTCLDVVLGLNVSQSIT